MYFSKGSSIFDRHTDTIISVHVRAINHFSLHTKTAIFEYSDICLALVSSIMIVKT